MAPFVVEFEPIARFLVRIAARIRPELGLGFVPKLKGALLATAVHPAPGPFGLEMVALLLGVLLAIATDPAPGPFGLQMVAFV